MLCRVSSARHLRLAHPRPSHTSEVDPDQIDVLEELTKLATQRNLGLLTPEEYEARLANMRAQLALSHAPA